MLRHDGSRDDEHDSSADSGPDAATTSPATPTTPATPSDLEVGQIITRKKDVMPARRLSKEDVTPTLKLLSKEDRQSSCEKALWHSSMTTLPTRAHSPIRFSSYTLAGAGFLQHHPPAAHAGHGPTMPTMPHLRSFHLASRRLTTFDAYMTTCETMWGVIIFLKFGTLVAQGGVLLTLAVLGFAATVQLMNCLCVSAVATNGLHSGSYSLLAANLGPAWGATASLVYYLGMTALATVEICGAVEALDLLLRRAHGPDYLTGDRYHDTAYLGSMGLVVLGLLRGLSSHIVHGISVVVLLAFFLTVGSSMAGQLRTASLANLHANLYPPHGWETLTSSTPSLMLTFIYPCFAGITQGANKASQLKTPYESIPKAAIGSVLTSAAIFLAIFLAVGASEPLSSIQEDDLLEAAWPYPDAAIVGVLTARALRGTSRHFEVVLEGAGEGCVLTCTWLDTCQAPLWLASAPRSPASTSHPPCSATSRRTATSRCCRSWGRTSSPASANTRSPSSPPRSRSLSRSPLLGSTGWRSSPSRSPPCSCRCASAKST